MTDVPKGRLPSTAKELNVYRKKPASASYLEQIASAIEETWAKDPKLHAVLQTQVFNGSAVEGTPIADKFASAIYVRALLIARGNTGAAEQHLSVIKNQIGTVLRRFDFTPLITSGSE